MGAGPGGGAVAHHLPLSVVHQAVSGVKMPMFGGQLFERVIVTPSLKTLGAILTTVQFPIEVWNTFLETVQTLSAINIGGQGDTTVANTNTMPLAFYPLQAFTFQARVPTLGVATIGQVVQFPFVSGIGGTSCTITGTRITLFSIAPDWSQSQAKFKEQIVYLTDVLRGHSAKEQRRALRQVARRNMELQVVTSSERVSSLLNSLLWGWQAQVYGVPYWPDARNLAAPITAGALAISVDTADTIFVAGGVVCLWRDAFTFEAVPILGVSSNSIQVVGAIQNSYPSGDATLVVPVILARLADKQDIRRDTSIIEEVQFVFAGEALQAYPTPTWTPPQYLGFPVLEVEPNWVPTTGANLVKSYSRDLIVLDSQAGAKTVEDRDGLPTVSTYVPWFLSPHSRVTAFRAFVESVKGRLRPFWFPTYDVDLSLHADVLAAANVITIRFVNYTRMMFPQRARQYLAFLRAGHANLYRHVTSAVNNLDGTETLTLDAPLGVDFPLDGGTVSFLTLVRLNSDSVDLIWHSTDTAEASCPLVEVPREVP